DIVVDKEFRGQGIGTKLIKTAIVKARDADAFTIDFTSRPSRESANLLYKKLGFKQRETNVYRLELH
ncbi:MAG: GNAT family N-acetyltransferase, partial [bacterium]|nr:GNAT family N-acetyltransferase [bacterium]